MNKCSNSKMITAKDLAVFFVALVLAAVFCVGVYSTAFQTNGNTVIVTTQNETLSFPLNENRTQTIEDGDSALEIQIENGEVRVSSSNCRGQDCVHSPAISRAGQVILCAPQRILITISSTSAPDAVVS